MDIDETIVHVVRSSEKLPYEHKINFKAPGLPMLELKFNVRPYLIEFLTEIGKTCNIAFMTASNRNYAEAIYGFIDPKKELIQGLFAKENSIHYSKGR